MFLFVKWFYDLINNVEINKICSGNICFIVCINKYDLMYDFVNIFFCVFNCKKRKWSILYLVIWDSNNGYVFLWYKYLIWWVD